jgi:molybdopterin-containing oxidoreductase family membrane subunit
MADEQYVVGLFKSGDGAASAIEALGRSPWKLAGVHSPFPEKGISDALGMKKSGVGYFTLAGGILGFLLGFALSIYTATRWNLVVSGKPVVAWIPFLIVGFECTILFSVLGNVIGFLTLARLPDFKGLKHHDPTCTGDRFGIVATCAAGEQDGLIAFFEKQGGEGKVLEKKEENGSP